MINISDYIPIIDAKEFIELSKTEWCVLKVEGGEVRGKISYERVSPLFKEFLGKLDRENLRSTFVASEAIKKGIKAVELGFEDCIALENIECRYTLEEYKQPYPAIFVIFPDKYLEYLKRSELERLERFQREHAEDITKIESLGISAGVGNEGDLKKILATIKSRFPFKNTPNLAISYLNESNDINFVILVSRNGQGVVSTLFGKDSNVEEYIDKEDGNKFFKRLHRVVFNINMLMVNLGMERRGYDNPQRQRALERMDRRDGGNRAKKEIYYVGLKQEIPLFRVVRRKEETGSNGTRKSPHPHWRRGHMRRVWVGPREGERMRKLVFIRPVFVCNENYGGDMTDTGATYS